jgi:hypothetical protein
MEDLARELPTADQARTAYRKSKKNPCSGAFFSEDGKHACPVAVIAVGRGAPATEQGVLDYWHPRLGMMVFSWLCSGLDGQEEAPDLLDDERLAFRRGQNIARALGFTSVARV